MRGNGIELGDRPVVPAVLPRRRPSPAVSVAPVHGLGAYRGDSQRLVGGDSLTGYCEAWQTTLTPRTGAGTTVAPGRSGLSAKSWGLSASAWLYNSGPAGDGCETALRC